MTQTTHKPTTATIIRQSRLNRGLTLEAMAEVLETSKQRMSQLESGTRSLPFESIREWATNPTYPDWVHNMARSLWIIHLNTEVDEMKSSINEFSEMLSD